VVDERAVLVIGPGGDPVPLPHDGALTIGRDPSNDVVIDSSTVSRRHAQIRSTVDRWLLTDLGSSNGTYVDGTMVVTAAGTVVDVGSQVRFGDVFGEIRSATPTARPRAASPAGTKVFVSYSRRDSRAVDRLVDDLERRGISAWVDRSGLVGGADWTTEIVNAIHEADAFVIALSRWSVASDDVANELHLAGERRLPVFPVLLEQVGVPETFAYHLAGRQRYDLSGDHARSEFDRLVRAIQSPRVRHRRGLGVIRDIAVLALVVVVPLLIATAVLSFLTGSVPPDIGRITGSRTCDGLDVALATDDVTTFVNSKTAHLAISFANSSTEPIQLSGWSVNLTSGGGSGEPYRFIENRGVEDRRLEPGGRTTGRVAVGGSFAPSSGDEPVRLEVSGLEQGGSVFAKCRATTFAVIRWG
jgi:pSer/pThr/pTyr-binding forkhead associated (FHA) protein